MKYKLFATVLWCSFFVNSSVFALDGVYSVVGLGYGDTTLDDSSASGLAYRIAIGYEFQHQWQAEFGLQRLHDEELVGSELGFSSQALTLSALGKARNRNGELFYRIGIAYLDVDGQTETNTQNTCNLGTLTNIDDSSLCSVDEGFVGGILGLGYDLYVGLNNQVRFEAEYILGDNQFSSGAIYVGYKYKF